MSEYISFRELPAEVRRQRAGDVLGQTLHLQSRAVLINQIEGRQAANAVVADFTRLVALSGLLEVQGEAWELGERIYPAIDRQPERTVDHLKFGRAVVLNEHGEPVALGPSSVIAVELEHIHGPLTARPMAA